jgi:glyoxylase I family protein
MKPHAVHHIAIICSDIEKSKQFYTKVLGMEILSENYRAERNSWKVDLALNGVYTIELFSFPDPPARLSQPEATGLRHLAFAVARLDEAICQLQQHGIKSEPVRTDTHTGKHFTFFNDPDGLPIEYYEAVEI